MMANDVCIVDLIFWLNYLALWCLKQSKASDVKLSGLVGAYKGSTIYIGLQLSRDMCFYGYRRVWTVRFHSHREPAGEVAMCVGGVRSHPVPQSTDPVWKAAAAPSIAEDRFGAGHRTALLCPSCRQDPDRNPHQRYVAERGVVQLAIHVHAVTQRWPFKRSPPTNIPLFWILPITQSLTPLSSPSLCFSFQLVLSSLTNQYFCMLALTSLLSNVWLLKNSPRSLVL